MNIHPHIPAPERPASPAGAAMRGFDVVQELFALLLAVLLAPALPGHTPGSHGAAYLAADLATRLLALLRAILCFRARAATPEQHRHALADLRTLRIRHPIPPRPRRFLPSRAARRRIAICFRMLVNRPRRRASFARPASAPRPRARMPARTPHLHPQPRARPPPLREHPASQAAFVCRLYAML